MSALHIERGSIIVAKDEFPSDACSIILSGKADAPQRMSLNIDDQHPLSVLRAGNMVGCRAWNCGGETVQ
jgi:hypothetical protein